jgi:hypothetical protein
MLNRRRHRVIALRCKGLVDWSVTQREQLGTIATCRQSDPGLDDPNVRVCLAGFRLRSPIGRIGHSRVRDGRRLHLIPLILRD